MKQFLKKLAYYDGDKYLKMVLADADAPAAPAPPPAPAAPAPAAPAPAAPAPEPVVMQFNQFVSQWGLQYPTIITILDSLLTKIETSKSAIASKTSALTWLSGTSHEYRDVNNKLTGCSEAIERTKTRINLINDYIKAARSAEIIHGLKQQADAVSNLLQQIQIPKSGVMGGSGWLGESMSSDIDEYLTPLKDTYASLQEEMNRLISLLNCADKVTDDAATPSGTSTTPTQPAATPATPATPAAKPSSLVQQSTYQFGVNKKPVTMTTISDRERQFMTSIQGKSDKDINLPCDARVEDILAQYSRKAISKEVANALISNVNIARKGAGGFGTEYNDKKIN